MGLQANRSAVMDVGIVSQLTKHKCPFIVGAILVIALIGANTRFAPTSKAAVQAGVIQAGVYRSWEGASRDGRSIRFFLDRVEN
ncbi:MAG: hypothetical protein HY283_00780 [Nitrospirae bacterium]|nr:hypothetical protein [Nitrospirota bacterium]